MDALASMLFPERRIVTNGQEIRIGQHGSISIDRQEGVFFDHEVGRGGDLIILIQHVQGCDFRSAIAYGAAVIYGRNKHHSVPINPIHCAASRKKEKNLHYRTERARRIWQESSLISGTLAEKYLREYRGITIALPPSLRFHPCLPYACNPNMAFPAMVAAVQGINRNVTGIQATYLNPDTGNKVILDNTPSRLSFGTVKGGAVRLSALSKRLVLTEGVEDALSILQSCPGVSVWACLGTSGLRGIELPENVSEVVIAGDNDSGGRKAAEVAQRRLRSEGRKVAVIYPASGNKDFNDELRRMA
ncbi:MAG: toprim domain-containing protein [Rickettsiales bacterium]|nr:toprim domain-containing protein [Rickettsiales bacterium]